MAKIQIKSEKITPFGGIYYASMAFMRFHLTKSSTALLVFAVLSTTATSGTRERDFVRLNNDFGWKFVFHFTAVCAKWTRMARSWWLNLYTGMPYDKLSFG